MTTPDFRRILTAAACLAGASLLVACSHISTAPPGMQLNQARATYGEPTHSCVNRNGERRVIWTMQPFGQQAWGATVNEQGQMGPVEQLLTDKRFAVLSQGTWTPEQVECEFGPPAEKGGVGLPSSMQIVWSYRYQQSGVWNSLMHVYFGQDGERVTRFHPGPDPMFDPDRRFFFG